MKKGQIQIIFTWIFILIVAGFILIYGIKFIRETQEFGEDAVVINFFQKLNDKIQLYYSLDIDSSGVEEFKLTNKIKYVCFTKNEEFELTDLDEENKQYLESLKTYDNVFLIPPVYNDNRFNITNLDISQNPTCVEVSGGLFKLRLETNVGGVDVEAA